MSDLLTDRPDCGDSSCMFSGDKGGQRTNGGCRCLQDLPRATQHFIARVYRSHKRLERELATAKAEQRKKDAEIARAQKFNTGIIDDLSGDELAYDDACEDIANAIERGE